MKHPRWYVAPAYRKRADHEILNADGEQVALFQELADAERVVELWNKQWEEAPTPTELDAHFKGFTLDDLDKLWEESK